MRDLWAEVEKGDRLIFSDMQGEWLVTDMEHISETCKRVTFTRSDPETDSTEYRGADVD